MHLIFAMRFSSISLIKLKALVVIDSETSIVFVKELQFMIVFPTSTSLAFTYISLPASCRFIPPNDWVNMCIF